MKKDKNLLSLLTFEELEIMELYIIGMKNEQISKRINNSKYFILKKVKSVIKKLNARNRIHAISIIRSEINKQDLEIPTQNYKLCDEKNILFSLKLNLNLDFKLI